MSINNAFATPLFLVTLTCLCGLVGCTSTRAYYPSNPAHLEQIPKDEELRVEMTDGTSFKASSIRVEGDSLFLHTSLSTPRAVHHEEIISVSKREVDSGKTAFLVGGYVVAAIIARLEGPASEETLCFGPRC